MHTRPDERQELLFLAEKGKSILMLAPRRVGKTWLMKRFEEDLRAAGWTTVMCDVEGWSTETDFLRQVCEGIEQRIGLANTAWNRAGQAVQQLFSGRGTTGNWRQLITQTDWKSFSGRLVRDLDDHGQKTMILIDELAMFVADLMRHDKQRAKEFLYHLRTLQQAHPNVRWLFTGSIGLDAVARRGDIAGALVDLHNFPLGPLSQEAA